QKKLEADKAQWEPSGFGSFMQLVAEILRGLVWVLVAGVLLYALYWVLRRLNWIRAPQRSQWTPPSTLFGLDVRPESLPKDVEAAAYAQRLPPQPEVEQLASEWPAFFHAEPT